METSCTNITINRGVYVYKEGEPIKAVYVVHDGEF